MQEIYCKKWLNQNQVLIFALVLNFQATFFLRWLIMLVDIWRISYEFIPNIIRNSGNFRKQWGNFIKISENDSCESRKFSISWKCTKISDSFWYFVTAFLKLPPIWYFSQLENFRSSGIWTIVSTSRSSCDLWWISIPKKLQRRCTGEIWTPGVVI